jgi:predicted aspartyl protease
MISRAVVAIVLAVGPFTGAVPVQADELKLHANRVYLPVTINGQKAEALLDSAAEGTFVDPKFAAQLGLEPEGSQTAKGSGGSTQVQFAKNVNVEAAGVKLPDMTVALLDMTELSKLVQTDLKIILGREFFDAARVEIDIAGGTIRKLDRSVQPAGVKLPLTSHRGIEHFPCTVEGIATSCDIDLGNGSEVLVGKAFAEKHKLNQPGRIVEKKQGGGIGGSVVRDIIVMSSLEVGGVTFKDVRGAIDPQPTAGEMNIGTSVLRSFVLVIDYSQRTVWFKPRK